MAKTFKYSNYTKTLDINVVTDGIKDQETFFITDINYLKGTQSMANQTGFDLDIEPTTNYTLEALAVAKNLNLAVYDDTTLDETLNVAENDAAEITAYAFGAVSGEVVVIDSVAGTIAVTVPNGTTVTALVATFTLSTDATAAIGATAQVSGTTANNFSTPKTYVVTSEYGNTKSWIVTVTVAA